MITRKIDLTANRDFSVSFNRDTISKTIKLNAMKAMSRDEYDLIAKYEFFWGIKTHICQAFEIFNNDNNLKCEMESYCPRCGAPLIPWKRFHGLCNNCENIINIGIYGKIPWKHENSKESREDPKEIFNLR